MKLGILDNELGIVVIEGIEDLGHIQMQIIKKQMPAGSSISDLALFYMSDRDWIVINMSHNLYEFYSQIVPAYLKLSVDNRKQAYAEAPTDNIRMAFDILDHVIRQRSLIYGTADLSERECNV